MQLPIIEIRKTSSIVKIDTRNVAIAHPNMHTHIYIRC